MSVSLSSLMTKKNAQKSTHVASFTMTAAAVLIKRRFFLPVIVMVILFGETTAFSVSNTTPSTTSSNKLHSTQQRTGLGQSVLDWALNSPIWKLLLVPMARQKIVDTAQANGIPWQSCRNWLEEQLGDTTTIALDANVPDWYRDSAYHSYETGHLSWQAAVEIELASAAVGARNIPQSGRYGETVFRQQFDTALLQAGAYVPSGSILVDFGCATGTSTRRLADQYSQAKTILGMDLSPYYIEVGKRLLALEPSNKEWICTIQKDDRIEYTVGDARQTELPENSVDVVQLLFVAHESPLEATLSILREAHRILRPGGQLWFCEMDFQAPAYAAQRANPLLFSLIRSTEPFLDDYADGQAQIWECLQQTFQTTVIAAATGRHFACVSTKGSNVPGTLKDLRFDDSGNYRVGDTHLQLWEIKK